MENLLLGRRGGFKRARLDRHRVVVLRFGWRPVHILNISSATGEMSRVEKTLDDLARGGRHIVVEVILQRRADLASVGSPEDGFPLLDGLKNLNVLDLPCGQP